MFSYKHIRSVFVDGLFPTVALITELSSPLETSCHFGPKLLILTTCVVSKILITRHILLMKQRNSFLFSAIGLRHSCSYQWQLFIPQETGNARAVTTTTTPSIKSQQVRRVGCMRIHTQILLLLLSHGFSVDIITCIYSTIKQWYLCRQKMMSQRRHYSC